MKNLKIISVVPDDLVFACQTLVQLSNFREHGYSDKYNVLVFVPKDRLHLGVNPKWAIIEKEFPEANFFYYNDEDNVLDAIHSINYIPLLRPYCLKRHFKAHPELEQDAIFYIDSDIVFTKPLDFTPYLNDDINYLSDTKSYLNSDYFDSMITRVDPPKLALYAKRDILNEVSSLFGIDRATCEKYKDATGGAQYLLKNIDWKFWEKVEQGCIKFRMFFAYELGGINSLYFVNEDAGFQSWCADMASILWTLWAEGRETITPQDLDFAWGTDKIARWNEVYIYHDAGGNEITDDKGVTHMLFHKRAHEYINNISTYFESDLSHISPDYCSYNYVQEINKAKKYNF